MISLGGALGGLFVGLVAPNLFNAYYEFPIGLGLCAIARGAGAVPARFAGRRWVEVARPSRRSPVYLVFLGVVMRDLVEGYTHGGPQFLRPALRPGRCRIRSTTEATRNLIHGVIDHGMQSLPGSIAGMPSRISAAASGIGIAMRALPQGVPHRIGMLGLGCGQLAAVRHAGRHHAHLRNQSAGGADLARTQFTYLRDTPARTEIVLGDARLSLEREPPQNFDLLVMDAFSGDSIPVHLVTREAFRTYFRHLKPDGILAVHISNLHLDLRPVVERASSSLGKIALLYKYGKRKSDFLCDDCQWVLVVDPMVRDRLRAFGGEVLEANAGFREWTDDYSTMRRILR